MGVYAIKPKFQKLINPLAEFLINYKIHPDIINVLGLSASLVMSIVLFYSKSIPVLYLVLPIGAFIRTLFNALDGMVARGLSISSPMGEVKNEFIDRLSDILILLSLGLSNHGNVNIAFIALALILLGSYLGILGKACGGKRVYVGILGKADRMILIGLAGIFAYYRINTWNALYYLMIVGSIITIFQRYFSIKLELNYESTK